VRFAARLCALRQPEKDVGRIQSASPCGLSFAPPSPGDGDTNLETTEDA